MQRKQRVSYAFCCSRLLYRYIAVITEIYAREIDRFITHLANKTNRYSTCLACVVR